MSSCPYISSGNAGKSRAQSLLPFFLCLSTPGRAQDGWERTSLGKFLPKHTVSPDVNDLYGLPRYGGERDGHADELAAAFPGLAVDKERRWGHDFGAPGYCGSAGFGL